MVTNDAALGERMRMIAAHGSSVRYYHDVLGVNSRLDTIQAAILTVKLKHLDRGTPRAAPRRPLLRNCSRGAP